MAERVVGIMGAMPEEVGEVVHLLTDKQEFSMGMRTYYLGKINGVKAVVVFSRWGKVAAATTATALVLKFGVTEIIFTGVAGAINSELSIGDVVVSQRLIQHDLDGRPLMPRYEVPLLGIKYIEATSELQKVTSSAVSALLEKGHLQAVIAPEVLKQFGIEDPKMVQGDIASGDKFFSKTEEKEALLENLPTIQCVEMEGAAVAQVCYEYGVSFVIIRTISDTADEKSHIDFPAFIEKVSNKYSVEMVKGILG